MTEIASCPFCEGVGGLVQQTRGIFNVACACGAKGPWTSDPEAAKAAWNRRATPAPAQPEDKGTSPGGKAPATGTTSDQSHQPEGAQEDEPVAWRYRKRGKVLWGYTDCDPEKPTDVSPNGWGRNWEDIEPLYLHPSRSADTPTTEGESEAYVAGFADGAAGRAAAPASSTSSGVSLELSEQAPVLSRAAAPVEGAMTREEAEDFVTDFERTSTFCDQPVGTREEVEKRFAELDALRERLVLALMAAPKERP